MAGQTIFIEYIPYDAEAHRAALSLARTLHEANWDVRPVTENGVDKIEDGVSVQPAIQVPAVNGVFPDAALNWRANERAGTLVRFLHSYNWGARRGFPAGARPLSAGEIRIQVGLYPAVTFVSPPGASDMVTEAFRVGGEIEKHRKQVEAESAKIMQKYIGVYRKNGPQHEKFLGIEWTRMQNQRWNCIPAPADLCPRSFRRP
jgi:hypothetical protein